MVKITLYTFGLCEGRDGPCVSHRGFGRVLALHHWKPFGTLYRELSTYIQPCTIPCSPVHKFLVTDKHLDIPRMGDPKGMYTI